MKRLRLAVLMLLALASGMARAENLFMVRSQQSFPEAMLTLQTAIREHGYTVSRVQRVDIGLTKSGFKTDKYRVVFFGKPHEVRELSAQRPELVAYLPLKVVIFAEGKETLLVAMNPARLGDFFPEPDMQNTFLHWESDLRSIFDDLSAAN